MYKLENECEMTLRMTFKNHADAIQYHAWIVDYIEGLCEEEARTIKVNLKPVV